MGFWADHNVLMRFHIKNNLFKIHVAVVANQHKHWRHMYLCCHCGEPSYNPFIVFLIAHMFFYTMCDAGSLFLCVDHMRYISCSVALQEMCCGSAIHFDTHNTSTLM
jgi:hypothetical protein